MMTGKGFDIHFPETDRFEPIKAIGCSVVVAALRQHEHVEALQKRVRISAPLIVDECFVNDQRPFRWQRGVCLAQKHLLSRRIPIVQNPSTAYASTSLMGQHWTLFPQIQTSSPVLRWPPLCLGIEHV